MDLPQFGTSHAYSPVMLKQLGTVRNKRNGTDAAHRKFILGDKTEMRIKSLAIILLAIMTGSAGFSGSQAEAQSSIAASPSPRAAAYSGSLPLTFEANQGQTAGPVKFLSRGKGYTAFLTANGMTLTLRPASGSARQPVTNKAAAVSAQPPTTLQFSLVGSAANPAVTGEDPQPGKINYFIGNDRTKWVTNVSTYAKVRYHNVYPGIDLVYYGNHRQLEYDFAVFPGENPNQIQFEINGAISTTVDSQGNLVLNTGNGELHFQTPTIYQEFNGTRVPVQGEYVMRDSTHVGFRLSSLDPTKTTVIDPVLDYATYLGGSGDDQPTGIAVDTTGNIYVAGYTDSTDFPLAVLGSLPAGQTHVFVAKLDATGSTLIYADYLGGNSDDYGFALALDGANEVFVTGGTASSNFPVVNAYQSVYPGAFNAFITQISADGSSLLYSTYFGGNGSDLPASIALDSSSNILIAGNTSSTNFPVANAYQSTASANGGGLYGNYGFISKFNPSGSQLIYSTYFAGNSNVPYNCGTPCWPSPYSGITALALDSTGNAYVTGTTNTYNFPTTGSAYQTTNTTAQDSTVSFVSKFSSSGTLTYSTYFYESSGVLTSAAGIAVDSLGYAYVTGSALSDGTFPITTTSICDPSTYSQNCEYAFVTKFDGIASTLLYSTFLGPYNLSSPSAISLDASDDAYILASTDSTTFQIVNGIEGFSSEGSQYAPGDQDILLVEIDPVAGSELFATYLGGSGNNLSAAMAMDTTGNIYVTGTTDSIDFPVTQGSFQGILGGNTDVFLAKIGTATTAAVSASPFSLEYASQSLSTASSSQTVLVRNMGSAALTIASITATGDFSQTNDCGSSVPAAGTCTMSVTFTPTVVGPDSGSVSIVDDAAGSPHVINLSGTGTGAVVALVPGSLTFTALPVGTASAQQTVSVSNNGNATLNISSIQVAGDFSQTNNCGSSLAASSSCQIQVTFTPTVTGARNGVLTLTDDAVTSPQTLALTGMGELALGISLAPASLSFTGQALASTSNGQAITITNATTSAVTISNVAITGDFTQTNNCTTIAANGGTCSVTVKFSPSVSGSRAGTLTISNSAGSPQTVSLSGTGLDFSVSSSTTSDSIQDGATATYTLTVTPLGGSFPNAVQLSCSGLPTEATCKFSPSTLTPGANPTTVTLTVSTTASVSQAIPGNLPKNYAAFAVLIQLQGLGLFGVVFAGSKKRSKKVPALILLALVIAGLIFMSACAGGTGIAPQSSSQSQTGTPAGSYTVSATGTSGSLKHSVPLTLAVQ